MSEHAPGQHETRDVRYGPIVAAGVALVILTVAAAVLMLPFMGALSSREAAKSDVVSPLAGVIGRRLPPQPRLQTHPLHDLEVLRESEDAALAAYAWVDEDEGIMRIPIERAIELLAGRAAAGGEG